MRSTQYNREQIDTNKISAGDIERLERKYGLTCDTLASFVARITRSYQESTDGVLVVDGKCGPSTIAHLRADYVLGIDVSHHEGDINWSQVSADPAGYRYMWTKATQGTSFVDARCEFNARGAKGEGLKIGYYHFADPDSGPVDYQIEHFLDTIRGLPPADLPHVLDVEKESTKYDRLEYTEFCETFMGAVSEDASAGGMVYTSARKVDDGGDAIISGDHTLGGYPLWSPRYGPDEPVVATGWDQWDIWQYTSTGKVAGISGDCDINRARRSWWDGLG